MVNEGSKRAPPIKTKNEIKIFKDHKKKEIIDETKIEICLSPSVPTNEFVLKLAVHDFVSITNICYKKLVSNRI